MYGVLIDTKTDRNVTEQRMRKLTALNVKQLPPLDMAIKRVKGDGKRQLRVFSDPMCPFCKKLESELERVNNVTIYVYPFPLEAKFPGLDRHREIDLVLEPTKAKAWEDWMLRASRPSVKRIARTPIEQIDSFAAKFKINATPTLVFADGAVVPQFVGAADIERFLNDTPE